MTEDNTKGMAANTKKQITVLGIWEHNIVIQRVCKSIIGEMTKELLVSHFI